MGTTPQAALMVIKKSLETTRPTFDEMNLNRLSFAKELEFALQAFEKNDYLAKTNAQSVKNCLVNIALSGLTLNPVLKQAYLVPRKGLCCVDPSYMGLVKIITDTGSVTDIVCRVVYEKDQFEIEAGSKGWVIHKPYKGADSAGRKVMVYSIATLPGGKENIDYMRWADVMAIKARSESVKSGGASPWTTDEDEMAKKTMVKRHWKLLPKSERAEMAANAIDLDNQANAIELAQDKKAASDVNATPNEPEEALATDEDLTEINKLLDNAEIPEEIFGNLTKTRMRKAVNNKYVQGQLTKSKAEEYIKGLKEELANANAKKEETDGNAPTAQ